MLVWVLKNEKMLEGRRRAARPSFTRPDPAASLSLSFTPPCRFSRSPL